VTWWRWWCFLAAWRVLAASGAVDSGGGADNSGADGSGNSGSSGGDTQRGFSFSQVAGSL